MLHQAIFEIRQYTLHPGARDTLIELFERALIEPQEADGMSLIGQFRDLDDPDRFVWLRGFPDMERRAASLGAFYGGPVWKANSAAANATMIDSDNVLLLRPGWLGAELPPDGAHAGAYALSILLFADCTERAFAERFRQTLLPRIERGGARVCGAFVSEHHPNTFPALPVRENEHAFAWFAGFKNEAERERFDAAIERDGAWQSALAAAGNLRATEWLRLAPTSRSRLR